MAESNSFFEDFTILVPEPKKMRIGKKDDYLEVDISVFPASAMLKLMKYEAGSNKATLEELVDVVVEACSESNPNITHEWLMKTNFAQLMMFCQSVIAYGTKQMNEFKEQMEARAEKKGGPKKGAQGKN